MTIDERLNRLTERHEALTQTVEIIAGMQRENEKNIANLTKNGSKLDAIVPRLDEMMLRLANIVIRHEERLDSLDGGGS